MTLATGCKRPTALCDLPKWAFSGALPQHVDNWLAFVRKMPYIFLPATLFIGSGLASALGEATPARPSLAAIRDTAAAISAESLLLRAGLRAARAARALRGAGGSWRDQRRHDCSVVDRRRCTMADGGRYFTYQ